MSDLGEFPDRLLLFDGICSLCNASVRFVLRHDPRERIHFAPLQSDLAKELLTRYEQDHQTLSSLVYLRKGRLFTRSRGALELARDLGFPWALTYLFVVVPGPLRDLVYDLAARNRYRWFGVKDACMLPPAGVADRFHGEVDG